ncbi:MAG: hypothetical protein AAGB01_12055 [Cyanobacteria bacterium P01_F01_bin.42]
MVNPQIASAVEQLDYRVTVGEVSARAGLEINTAQAGLLSLASDVGANLQVSEYGDITYLFPRNYRSILRNKYFRLRLQELWQKVWAVLFYLIRISFGIFLVVSIALIFAAIAILVMSTSSDRDDRRGSSFNVGGLFWMNDLLWWFSPGHRRRRERKAGGMNFFEALFSVLFGDGNPNADLEQQRWQTIGAVIRSNKGAITAEQVMPYLDLPENLGDEDFMIPVLSRFNGYPQVTDQGELIYHFPELQTLAVERQQQYIPSVLRESPWQFSSASSTQVGWTVGLGVLNLVGALALGSMLSDSAIAVGQTAGFVGFVGSILGILLAYGVGFLAIPLGRYFWIQSQNKKIQVRNGQRQQRAIAVQSPSASLKQKLQAAEQLQSEVVLSEESIAYTTEKDLLEQAFDE